MARSHCFVNCTLVVAVLAAGLAPGRAAAQDPTPTMEYRQAIMGGLAAHRGALTTILNEEVPHQGHVLGHALSLQHLATMASDIFPEGSHGEGSRALPAIWEDAMGFAEALTALQTATDNLVDGAQAGDMEAVGEASGSLGRTCGGCHRDYRARAGG